MAQKTVYIGKYKIQSLVAKGGMGAVYKAIHPTLKREIILKKLTIRSAQFIERFRREAQIMMDFKHENIVTVWDHFKEGASYYIVLEYIDGCSLAELIKREGALPSSLALYLLLHIARALKYAHDRGVIHRDIKPANVLLSRSGEIKLADFGIAAREDASDKDLTQEGTALGTPSYMPPEQFEGTKQVDKSADIYALGVLLYEICSGERPFPASFTPETIIKIQKGRYTSLKKLAPRTDPLVHRLIKKMIQPKKKKRYQDLGPIIKLLLRELNADKRKECARHLHALMNHRPFTPAKKKKRQSRTVKKNTFLVLALFAIITFGFFAIFFDALKAQLRPSHYGIFRIELNHKRENKNLNSPLRATLYSEKEGTLNRLKTIKVPSIWDNISQTFVSKKKDREALLRSASIYLPRGAYRLKLELGNSVLWDSWLQESISEKRMENKRPCNLRSYYFKPALPKPITFHFSILDALDGKDLHKEATVRIQNKDGNWLDYKKIPEEDYLSGEVYKIRFEAAGYNTQIFSLLIEKEQTEVEIRAALYPNDS